MNMAHTLELPVQPLIPTRRSTFYYPMLMLPRPQREAILTVYDFCRYTDDIVDLAEEGKAVYNPFEFLNRWKTALDEAIRQKSPYPLLNRLVDVARRFSIPFELFFELIRGVEMDLTQKRYVNFDELYKYCYRVASTVGLMSMRILTKNNPDMEAYAENLGIGMQLTNIIRDVAADHKMNRIYLPQTELNQWGVSESDITEKRITPQFRELILFQCERAKGYYRKADELYGKNRSYIFIPARAVQNIYYELLLKSENNIDDLLMKKISLSFPKKISIMLGTWWKEK